MRIAHNFKDLTGQTFHRLTVVSRLANRYSGQSFWRCVCACGAEVEANASQLRTGHTKSCGCFSRDQATRHGQHKTSEYQIWQQAKERCHNPKKGSYARYGARGIYMVDAWRGDFTAFYRDMGPRPSKKHTLDRIDNDGPYSPENCRWVTNDVQCRNRRQTVWIAFQGETLCQKDWCRRYSLDEATFTARIKRGWALERALTTPPAKQTGKNFFPSHTLAC